MEHINTWPNYYVNNETYLNFNWNFDNFEEVINKVEDLNIVKILQLMVIIAS